MRPAVTRPRSALRRVARSLSSALVQLALIALLSLAIGLPARADEPRPLHTWTALELPLLGVGVISLLATEISKPQLAPSVCRLCSANALDARVQERLLWNNPRPAHRLSDALLFGLVPAAAIGSVAAQSFIEGSARTALVDLLVITEALVLTANLTQIAKYSAARERPYVRLQREQDRDWMPGADDHLSFFSGHTSSTFALAVAAGSVASFRGYRHARVVWGIGLPLAALTGYLRIAADRHYLTDVLTGAVVGSLVGALVPWLHTLGESAAPQPSVGAVPPTLTLSWVR